MPEWLCKQPGVNKALHNNHECSSSSRGQCETEMAEVRPSTTFSTLFHYATFMAGTATSNDCVSFCCCNKHCTWDIVYIRVLTTDGAGCSEQKFKRPLSPWLHLVWMHPVHLCKTIIQI